MSLCVGIWMCVRVDGAPYPWWQLGYPPDLTQYLCVGYCSALTLKRGNERKREGVERDRQRGGGGGGGSETSLNPASFVLPHKRLI